MAARARSTRTSSAEAEGRLVIQRSVPRRRPKGRCASPLRRPYRPVEAIPPHVVRNRPRDRAIVAAMGGRLLQRINGVAFGASLAFLAKLARRARWHGLARFILRRLAAASSTIYGVKPAQSPDALGAAWQSVFPSKRMVPIERIDPASETVHARIHVQCPLRGTGDVHACHRLMEYDREVA